MRIALVLMGGLFLATPVLAKGRVALRTTLVPAQCEGPPAGPCSALRFAKATADLTTAKQPSPTCPKTGGSARYKLYVRVKDELAWAIVAIRRSSNRLAVPRLSYETVAVSA